MTFQIDTMDLPPNNAFTVWMSIFEDGLPPTGPPMALRVGSGLSTEFGTGHFSGSLNVGEIGPANVVEDEAHNVLQDGDVILVGDGEFDTPWTAVVNFTLRTHGEAIPGRVGEQMRTLIGGDCLREASTDPVCYDAQVATFP